MTTCQTCDASYSNSPARIVRCGTCVFQDGKPPTNWRQAQACQLCDAQPGQEHAPACPRHPSDPMGVRSKTDMQASSVLLNECCPRCLRDGWVERESECQKHGNAGVPGTEGGQRDA